MYKLKLKTVIVIIFFILCIFPFLSEKSIGAGNLTVTYPSGGETLYQKEQYSIYWTSQDIGNYVKIELCKNGYTYYTIATSTHDDGFYQWQIPTSVSGSNYYIKITSIQYKYISNTSGTFDIKPQYITVTSPSSSSILYGGKTYTIKWSADIYASNVAIYCELGDDSFLISSSTPNDGSYAWIVATSLSSSPSYKIKVSSATNSDIYDYSPYFRINERLIDVYTPASGDILRIGKTYTISWEGGVSDSYVDIYLEINDNLQYIDQAYNDGSYSWTVSENYHTSSSNRIVIYSISDSSNYDYSGTFTIRRETISITQPYENDKWYKGKTKTIRWSSENAGSYLDISLYKNGQYFLTIASNAYNSGRYYWSIPSDIETNSEYQIKITSLSISDLYDFSDYFIIDEQYIRLTSPTENSIWYKGNIHQIKWQSKNVGENVIIELFYYRSSNKSYRISISSKTYNDGTFSWKIPNDLSTDYTYKIKIRDWSDNMVYNYSGNFSINESITISSISSFESWTIGESHYINWDSKDVVGEYVKIELLNENEEYFTIAENTNNDGSFLWEIPDSIKPGISYKIKISSSLNPDLYAISKSYLQIEKPILEFEISAFLIFIVVLIVVIPIIFAIIKIWKRIKNKELENISKIEEQIDQFIVPQEIKTYEISEEEYERIWEKSEY